MGAAGLVKLPEGIPSPRFARLGIRGAGASPHRNLNKSPNTRRYLEIHVGAAGLAPAKASGREFYRLVRLLLRHTPNANT